ncbi:MAG: RNA 2',3'-cyclic phosphodiesterase [Planctomycetota bacterium]
MRTFIAVDFDEAIRERLAAVQQDLSAAPCKIKWVKPAAMHATLKFLGEIDPEQVEPVAEAMAAAADGVAPFEVQVRGLGAFPPRGAPRVVWAGMDDPAGGLARLNEALEQRLSALGFKRERRPFHAHLTIGRVKGRRGGRELRALLEAEPEAAFGTQRVDGIVLYHSELSPQGATYRALRRHAL